MSDDLVELARKWDENGPPQAPFYATGVLIAAMADRIEELQAKLDQAQWLLIDASVQLREGKIRTRRNRADLIDTFLAELTGSKSD